ncbi:MAG: hypothetical protein CR997_02480 [Acidobacteria bacterium]|nr:MAG: hypothetical protein CR997_02480 [Acidobacteriota bacterium]
MLVDLTKVEKGRVERFHMVAQPHAIGDPSFSAEILEGSYSVSIQQDPMGFFLKYQLEAQVQTVCSVCGEELILPVASNGGLALRFEQPAGQHIVLNADELDVRFLKEKTCDLQQLFDEQVELEITQFPRHGNDCRGTTQLEEQHVDSQKENKGNSPFAVLSSLIENQD